MALLQILQYPDASLYTVAKRVERVDDSIRKLISDMTETMYAAPGVGLAATQVDKHLQIIIADVSETHNDLRILVNPELKFSAGECEREEGCLSVPGIYEKIRRAERIQVRALDGLGKPFSLETDGLLARCILHEMDHLHGKVFVEYLSPLKQSRLRAKLKKRQRETL
ncbi:MAG: peptide deformylase [Gallionellaceae bacterium]